MPKTYTIAWIQDGEYCSFTLRFTHDVVTAIDTFVNSAMCYLPESCKCNVLFENDRLIARQATYDGVA